MVIGIFGESCTGKSTLAAELSQRTGAAVYTGKEYIKLAKNEAESQKIFTGMLQDAVTGPETVVYVISEREHLPLLPEKAVRVLVTADLDVIKERFAKRMNGRLPAPVASMLEKKHGMFDGEKHDLHVHSAEDVSQMCNRILELSIR